MQDANSKFRLDRRLALRRGWIAPEQLEKEVSGLPDVAEKAEVIDSPQNKGEAEPAAESGD
ncbi:MAG TPA: hypothetical protein VFT98_20330 [Myxococcota bacterium]|nr:hypothetical protein [Myxococcota bacterium]